MGDNARGSSEFVDALDQQFLIGLPLRVDVSVTRRVQVVILGVFSTTFRIHAHHDPVYVGKLLLIAFGFSVSELCWRCAIDKERTERHAQCKGDNHGERELQRR